jgi:hypothetical protein
MAFKKVRGKTKVEWLDVTVSTAFSKDSLVEWTSGYIAPADDNDTDIAGVIIKAIASTDDDYATARQVPILVPVERHVVWEADTADTFVLATHQGVECGAANSTTVDLDDTTNDVFKVISGSGTKVRGYLKVNGAY